MRLRLSCRWRGCSTGPDCCWVCERCDAPVYAEPGRPVWIDRGWYHGPLFAWWHWLRRLSVPRCLHCRRVLLFRRRYGWDGGFCSDACADSWLPF